MRIAMPMILSMALFACGGSPGDSGPDTTPDSVTGSVKGETLPLGRAILSGIETASATSAYVTLSTVANECENVRRHRSSTPSLELQFIGGRDGVVAGEYTWISDADLRAGKPAVQRVAGYFNGTDASRTALSGGTFTVVDVHAGEAASLQVHFEAQFGQDALSGSFHATPCPP